MKTIFNISLFCVFLGACSTNQNIYISKKCNLVIIMSDNSIEGFTIHPEYNKYSCNIYFKGINSNGLNSDTASVFIRSINNAKELTKIGFLTYRIENNLITIKYKTSNVGCADWIFPNSNDNNTQDTFNLVKQPKYINPRIVLLNHGELSSDFIIIHKNKNPNAIIHRWNLDVFLTTDTFVSPAYFYEIDI